MPLALVTSASSPAVASKSAKYQMQLSYKQLMNAPRESEGAAYFKGRERYTEARYLAGTKQLSPEQAAKYRAAAASKYGRTRHTTAAPQQYLTSPTTAPSWSSVGPSSVFQVGRTSNTFQRVSGRISALAVNNQGDIYAGGAQGGLWRRDHVTHLWTALTDNLPTLSVGAVAIAPSNQNIIYLATGEGDLSGDSYYGDGIWRSTDAGGTWTHVSGTQFPATSITRLLVDPRNADTVYVATIRGRGGSRRVSPPTSQTWGIYRSDNGGSSWRLLKGTTDPNRGATDLEFDPTRPGALFATFWNDGVYRSGTDQVGWQNITTKIAKAINIKPDFSGSRFSIATAKVGKATRIYAGFDWHNSTNGVHRSSRLFRSDDDGEHWTQLPFGTPGDPDSVLNYCDIQCTYDNVVEVDPSNPNVVYAAGEYTYTNSPQLGGIYQSTDGGSTWQTLGVDLHPDFHALAMQPNDPAHVVIGNDGGVWDTPDRGGRQPGPIMDCLSAWFNHTGPACVDWVNLNKGLGIAQADSVDYANADNPDTFWSGTQDNGTQSTLPPSAGWPYGTTWVDNSSGDGGQVVVDHSNPNFVFGTYYNLTGLFRFSHAQDDLNTGNLPTFTASNIMNGIDKSDRSEFYIPLVLNQGHTNQLVTGTQRVYRTDNAEAPVASDVQWQPISDDLTSGCTGSASNGGRACVISALGMSDGGTGGYAGTEEGWVWHADDMLSSSGNANWVRSDEAGTVLPGRPVGSFAVDKSNWRTAYVSFEGYNAATPGVSGHVFKTTDGGQTWTNVTGNLPDNPVNSLLLDPSDPNTLYAGSDVGAFVTHDDGTSWAPIGSGLPRVNVWQMDYDPSRAMLVAGTHGRGTWTLDTAAHAPAFVASISDPGTPVGPGVDLPYTITVKNIGNADATGVTVTDPVPDHTTVKSSDNGGAPDGNGNVVWNGLSIPAGGSVELHLTVTIDPDLDPAVTQIVNDGLTVTSAEGPSTTGSPHVNPISPQFAVSATPASELRSAQRGDTTTLTYKVTNQGYGTEAFDLSVAGNSWTTVVKPGCSTEAASTDVLAPGDSEKVCVDVTVPPDATPLTSDEFTLTVSPANSSDTSLDKDVTGTTVALDKPVLLVDEDGATSGSTDAQAYYTDALTAAGVSYDVVDLATTSLPDGYLNGYKEVYWFTGTSYPTPLSPYEKTLTTYLDAGGKLFMDGMDLLDQSGGTSPFAKNYLHVDWDGSEVQNDKSTTQVHGVGSTVIGDGLAYDLTHFASYGAFEDEITPNGPAVAEFQDDSGAPDGLSVTDTSNNSGSSYKVVFFAFPLEEVGTATDRSDIVKRIESYFSAP